MLESATMLELTSFAVVVHVFVGVAFLAEKRLGISPTILSQGKCTVCWLCVVVVAIFILI